MAKVKVTETAKGIALEGMQMMGGYGCAAGHRVVSVGLRGTGQSDKPLGTMTWPEAPAEFRAALCQATA